MTNASGNVANNMGGIREVGSIIYSSNLTPWISPDVGNFSITNNAVTRAAGRGTFIETASGYSGTVGYPDIGAAQSITNATAAAAGGSYTFSQ